MRHAATGDGLSTVPIFRQPSILRNLICPLATRLKSRVSAASRQRGQQEAAALHYSIT